MTNHLWLIPAAVLCFLAMTWLALSLKTHWQQLYSNSAPKETKLRFAGSFALTLSALCCLIADHPSMAILVWVLLIPAASISVAMILARRPSLMIYLSKPFS